MCLQNVAIKVPHLIIIIIGTPLLSSSPFHIEAAPQWRLYIVEINMYLLTVY